MRAILLPATVLLASISVSSLTIAAEKNTGQQSASAQVLMILSGYGKHDSEQKLIQPGYEFDEFSKAYLVFKHNGIKVTIASPHGGKPIADEFNRDKSYNAAVLQDENAMYALKHTKPFKTIQASDYDAVFVVGGKGPMFDLADNTELQAIIRDVYERDQVVAAVCHGPAALTEVKLSDGSYLIKGKHVTGFTELEEQAFSKTWAAKFPFQLQSQLIKNGARFEQDGLMLNQVVVDGNLITGQNPFSTTDAAKAVVKQLTGKVQAEPVFQDDATILLSEQFFKDINLAISTYRNDPKAYDTMLMAMLGFYQAQHAKTEHQLSVAIALMQETDAQVNHPMLTQGLAEAQLRLGDKASAQQVLASAVKRFPESTELAALQAKVAAK
ncbi:DJ-1/PfpI family protein [Pseudoalteromonas fenneropenaei]|uniref:DJ-1/PfpI family protein n=1 Tax=Pseudoalteromonas fenneropenaei TaxID=1737459 RepID=A0ABV7CHI4_9GAMM